MAQCIPKSVYKIAFLKKKSTKYIYETLFIKIPNVLHVTTTVMVPLERENTRNVIIYNPYEQGSPS